MEYSRARLDSIKQSFAKSGIYYDTDEEYIEAMNNMVGYFDILIQMDLRQNQAKKAKKDASEKPSQNT